MSYKVCNNLNRVYNTTGVEAKTTSTIIGLPSCVNQSRVFFVKIDQTFTGTASAPIYFAVNGVTYQLFDMIGVPVLTSSIAYNSVLLITRLCTISNQFRLINFLQTSSTDASASVESNSFITPEVEPEVVTAKKSTAGKMLTGLATLAGVGAVASAGV